MNPIVLILDHILTVPHMDLKSDEALLKFFQEILDKRDELEELEKKQISALVDWLNYRIS